MRLEVCLITSLVRRIINHEHSRHLELKLTSKTLFTREVVSFERRDQLLAFSITWCVHSRAVHNMSAQIVSASSQSPTFSIPNENSSDRLSRSAFKDNSGLKIEGTTHAVEDDRARPSKSTHLDETIHGDVERLAFALDQDWPDKIELLKQIQTDDRKDRPNELD